MNLRQRTTGRRAGISLLEMVLSLAIAMLVLSALYWAMSTQFGQAQAGREVLDEGTLARSILLRITNDVAGQLSMQDATASVEAVPITEEGADEAEMPMEATATPVAFNVGVHGEANRLVLCVNRVSQAGKSDAPVPGELRRITYRMVEGGLAREELTEATSESLDRSALDEANPERFVIAPEVSRVEFRFFDGSAWQTSWYGDDTHPDLGVPMGPPAAIEVTLTLRFVEPRIGQEPIEREATYRHVVALPAANHFPTTATGM